MLKSISQEEFTKNFDDGKCPNVFTVGLSTEVFDLKVLRALINHFKSQMVLELGVRYGHSAKFLLEQCPCITKYVGIDVPFSFETVKDSQQPEVPLQTGIMASFDERFEAIVLENGTQDIEEYPDKLNYKFDFIFIDADHSVSGILRDTKISMRLIKKGGIVVWHDYGNEYEITEFLNNFAKNDDSIFIVEESLCCFKIC